MNRSGSALCIAFAVLLAFAPGGPAQGQEQLAATCSWFDIALQDGVEIKRKTVRAIEKEATAAIEAGLELLGLDAKRVFYLGSPAPAWMGQPDKLRFLIVEEVSRRRQGVDHWVTQLHAGGFTIELPVPEEELSEEFRRRVRREVGAALIGNTLFKAGVPWWTTGVLRVLEESATEESATEEPSAAVVTAREKLALVSADELEKMVAAVLAAARQKELPKELGVEISYFLVDLLQTAHPDLIRRLQRQMQTMAYHLLHFPDQLSLRRDFARLLREQLADGAEQTASTLSAALALWAEEGWRRGRAFRRTKLARRFRNAPIPKPFEVDFSGQCGKPERDEAGQLYYVFKKPGVEWSLPPLDSKYEFWVGLHGKLPRGDTFQPEDLATGPALRLETWAGEPLGRLSLPTISASYVGLPMHYNWMLLDVVSRNGVTYRFYRYWKR